MVGDETNKTRIRGVLQKLNSTAQSK